jgi:hypothetical protein
MCIQKYDSLGLAVGAPHSPLDEALFHVTELGELCQQIYFSLSIKKCVSCISLKEKISLTSLSALRKFSTSSRRFLANKATAVYSTIRIGI